MNASPEVKDVLRLARMRRWLRIINYPSFDKNCSTSRARRNYLKLVRRHQSLAAAHRLTERDAFESDT